MMKRCSVGLVVASVSFLLAMPVFASAPTAQDFAMKPTATMMTLGPDGTKVSYISTSFETICRTDRRQRLPADRCDADERELASNQRLVILDVTDPKMSIIREVAIPKDYTVNWVEWSSDDTVLLSINTRWVIGARYWRQPIGRIISVKADGSNGMSLLFGEEEKLRDNNVKLSRVVDMLRADPDHVIMTANRNDDYDLFKVNVNDGTADRIAKGHKRTMVWITSKTGEPAVRFDCTNDTCRTMKISRLIADRNPSEVADNWEDVRTVDYQRRAGEDVYSFTIVAPTDHPDHFYVEVEGEGDARRSIKIYDIRTDEFVDHVFSDSTHDVQSAVFNRKTGSFKGAVFWQDRLKYYFVDDQLSAHLDGINRTFDDRWNVRLKDLSDTGQVALIHASSPQDVGAYYLYRFENEALTKIRPSNQALQSPLATHTDILSIPTRDGQSITGYHTLPTKDGETASTGPLIILVHGGPEQRDRYDYDRDVQFLASRGYEVLQINFRGSSGYGRAFAEAGYKQWGGTMHNDVIDATRFMQSKQFASPDRTCVMGHSYGGFAALLAGARQSQLYSCVISGAGISDLHQSLRDDRKMHGKDSRTFDYWTKSIGDIKKDRAELDAASPINLANQFDDPVLLIHGEYDRVVMPHHSSNMEKALRKAGQSVELLELDEGHYHNQWSIESSTEYFETLENFLETVFPGAAGG